MPELPEVETIRRDLSGLIAGRTIAAVHIISPSSVRPSAALFKKGLVGRKVVAVNRRAKLLILALSGDPVRKTSGRFLLIHLKMTGQLIYRDKIIRAVGGHSLSDGSGSLTGALGGELPNKHTRVILDFQPSGRSGKMPSGHLFFNDLRRFGYLKIVDAPELARILERDYGPEPLTPEFSLAGFSTRLKNRRLNLKAFLLNQKLIAGLGNIYADEALFAAGLRPTRLAASLTARETDRLFQAIIRVLKSALKHRGTTFNNYRDSAGRKGNFSRRLKVYGRGGAPCLVCGRPIVRIRLAGRGTHYCSHCQK